MRFNKLPLGTAQLALKKSTQIYKQKSVLISVICGKKQIGVEFRGIEP